MKYESGAKVQDLRIKIRETRFEVIEGVKIPKPGIIIQFVNGEFDSEEWQKQDPEERTDKLRQVVEAKIEADPNYGQIGNPRGLWRMTDLKKREEGQVPAPEPIEREKCEAIVEQDGQHVQCQNEAVAGAKFCDDHILETV